MSKILLAFQHLINITNYQWDILHSYIHTKFSKTWYVFYVYSTSQFGPDTFQGLSSPMWLPIVLVRLQARGSRKALLRRELLAEIWRMRRSWGGKQGAYGEVVQGKGTAHSWGQGALGRPEGQSVWLVLVLWVEHAWWASHRAWKPSGSLG